MNLRPIHLRSDLEQHFRNNAALALLEHHRLFHSEGWSGNTHLEGIKWGLYIGYKQAAEQLSLGITSAVPKGDIEYDALNRVVRVHAKKHGYAHLSGDQPYGTPVHLKQLIDTASADHEAGNRPKLTPDRANPHD
jgi:hypothetical protein